MLRGDISHELVLDQLHDGVYFVDEDGRITFWNRGAERITGYTREEMIGRTSSPALLGHTDEEGLSVSGDQTPVLLALEDGEIREQELYLRHKTGDLVPVMIRVSPIHNSLGETIGGLEVFSDNSSRMLAKRRIEELEAIALICPLTGVGNRRYAQLSLQDAVEEYQRYGRAFGVLFADIDLFKQVNDNHGHSVGDAVLSMTAQALKQSVRSIDFVGRWGGEEFVLILPNVNDERLATVAERCRSNVENSVCQQNGKAIQVTISIGAILAIQGESAEECLERADKLMYTSKANGAEPRFA